MTHTLNCPTLNSKTLIKAVPRGGRKPPSVLSYNLSEMAVGKFINNIIITTWYHYTPSQKKNRLLSIQNTSTISINYARVFVNSHQGSKGRGSGRKMERFEKVLDTQEFLVARQPILQLNEKVTTVVREYNQYIVKEVQRKVKGCSQKAFNETRKVHEP
jgi:hypothetical protein